MAKQSVKEGGDYPLFLLRKNSAKNPGIFGPKTPTLAHFGPIGHIVKSFDSFPFIRGGGGYPPILLSFFGKKIFP